MRLLAVADVEEDILLSQLSRAGRPHYDAVISCGDLRPGYLDSVATLANAPLCYVRGNHDVDECGYDVMGGMPLDGRIVEVGGLRIAGLDGSLLYREGIVGRTEREMRMRAAMLAILGHLSGGIDVLVTHAPPRGHGDLDDLPHRGFESLNWLLGTLKPRLLLHGHVHMNYGMVERERAHPSGTRLVNAYGHWEGELEPTA